jgi:hypothetical protein
MADGKNTAGKDDRIQMKIFVGSTEHAVIKAGPILKKVNVTDYMPAAILKQAKESARELAAIIVSRPKFQEVKLLGQGGK